MGKDKVYKGISSNLPGRRKLWLEYIQARVKNQVEIARGRFYLIEIQICVKYQT